MNKGEFSILGISKTNKGYITLVNNSSGEEIDMFSRTVENYLEKGILNPRIVYPTAIHKSERYVICLESVLGGEVYYSGFNILFDRNIGVTCDVNKVKIFESFDKALSKAEKLAKKSDMLFIYLKELNVVRE